MKSLLIAAAALPLMSASGFATTILSAAQLDTVSAGQLPSFECDGCVLSSSNSSSNNGVTTVTNTSQVVGGGTGTNSESSGSSGNGNGSGNTGGSGGTTPSGPSIGTPVSIPSNLTTIVGNATTISLQK